MTTLNLTDKETQMVKAFIAESVDCCGDCSHEDGRENLSYMNAQDLAEVLGWDLHTVGGVMSSLDSKCAISDTGESPRGARINDYTVCTRWPEIAQLVTEYMG